MADQPNVFDDVEEVKPVTQAPSPDGITTAPPADTQYADLLNGIRNENGQPKYDSLPKALEGLANAQQYIPQLKAELQQKEQELVSLRAELEKRAAVEDVVTRLTSQNKDQEDKGLPPKSSGLDEQAVMQLVQDMLGKTKQADMAQSNQAQVQQALSSMYGEKSRSVVEAKAKELGTTPAELGKLASQNPAMVLALFGSAAKPSVKPTTGGLHLPSSYANERAALERPTKSLLSGATSKEQAAYMQKVKEEVYARYGIQ